MSTTSTLIIVEGLLQSFSKGQSIQLKLISITIIINSRIPTDKNHNLEYNKSQSKGADAWLKHLDVVEIKRVEPSAMPFPSCLKSKFLRQFTTPSEAPHIFLKIQTSKELQCPNHNPQLVGKNG